MKNKFLMMLLSVALSFSLWAYVALVVSPESEDYYSNIPVVLDGTSVLAERNLMIISDTNLTVDLKLSGNRQDLNKLDSTNITILADLSQITQAGEHEIKYSISYPGTVQNGTIEVLEQKPPYITVVVVEWSKKNIPVKVNYTGSVPDNFIADTQNAVLDHTSVTVSGPRDVVDRIDCAKITIDLTDATSNITDIYTLALCDSEGKIIDDVSNVTASTGEILATVKISQIKTVDLVYSVEHGGGITEDMVVITPKDENRTWITVSGSQADLAGLDTIYVGTIDLGELTESGLVTFYFRDLLPENVTNVSGYWEVSYYVEMPAMETREFKVTNFQTANVPTGRHVQVKTEELIVTLRGPAELLNQLTDADIVAVVDGAEQTILDNANQTLYVTILVPIEGVGAVGEYKVTAYVGIVQVGTGE